MAALSRYEGLTVRRLPHGGYLVHHPDIYTEQSLYFAGSTLVETFAFIQATLDKPSEPGPETQP